MKSLIVKFLKDGLAIIAGGLLLAVLPFLIWGFFLILLGKESVLLVREDDFNYWEGVLFLAIYILPTRSIVFFVAHQLVSLGNIYNRLYLMLASGVYFWFSILLEPVINRIFFGQASLFPLYLLSLLLMAMALNGVFFHSGALLARLFRNKDKSDLRNPLEGGLT